MASTLADEISREIRAEMGRQQRRHRELAAHLGLSQGQTSARLRGEIEFRPSELEKAAEFLGVPVSLFFPKGNAA